MLVWFSAALRLVLAESSLLSSLSREPGRASVPCRMEKAQALASYGAQFRSQHCLSLAGRQGRLLNAADPHFSPLAQGC